MVFLNNEKNLNWKGDNVGSRCLHKWINRHKPKPDLCVRCHQTPPFDLANISGLYKRDVNDFEWLCRRCHVMSENRRFNIKVKKVSDSDLIADLKRLSSKLKKKITGKDLKKYGGKHNIETYYVHFGSWSMAKKIAGVD